MINSNAKHKVSGRNGALCPYLGAREDPDTALSYPSQHNCCNHAKPVVAVSLVHQRTHCLTDNFEDCPVFKQEKIGRFPKELKGHPLGGEKSIAWVPIVALFGVIIVGLIGSIILGALRIPGLEGMVLFSPQINTPITQIPSPTATLVNPTNTPTPKITPTATLPLFTPTPILPHLLETPIGGNPQLVIHRIVDGEGFILLAETYNTTVQAIKAVNYLMKDTLMVNKIMVIPVNLKDVTALPAFTTWEVVESGVTIEELAKLELWDTALVKKFNGLPDGYILEKGSWLLIPH